MQNLTDEKLNIATREDVEYFLHCTNEGDIRFRRIATFFNIAICGWRGWILETQPHGAMFLIEPDGTPHIANDGWTHRILPSHITGIEALGHMHEAEKGLTEEQKNQFFFQLSVQADTNGNFMREVLELMKIVSSPARQRAIALLHVVKPEVFE